MKTTQRKKKNSILLEEITATEIFSLKHFIYQRLHKSCLHMHIHTFILLRMA